MRSKSSAKRWISVFASVQDSAIVHGQNVMNFLLHCLGSQEGRMTFYGMHVGKLCPANANPGNACHRPGVQPVVGTGPSQDCRYAFRSR